ncbi:MAG: hypothetical protein MZV65_00020 [Chromatiales bacterium]|nr:hypothetical protein [Chromatiales bacterium]
MRAIIEHSLDQSMAAPMRYYYHRAPCSATSKPQKGRYRQFHQIDVEVFGEIGPGRRRRGHRAGRAPCSQELGHRGRRDWWSTRSAARPAGPRYGEALREAARRGRRAELCADCQRQRRRPTRCGSSTARSPPGPGDRSTLCRIIGRLPLRRVPRRTSPRCATLPRRCWASRTGSTRAWSAASTTTPRPTFEIRRGAARRPERDPRRRALRRPGEASCGGPDRRAASASPRAWSGSCCDARRSRERRGPAPCLRRPRRRGQGGARLAAGRASCGAAGVEAYIEYEGRSIKAQFEAGRPACRPACALILGEDEIEARRGSRQGHGQRQPDRRRPARSSLAVLRNA